MEQAHTLPSASEPPAGEPVRAVQRRMVQFGPPEALPLVQVAEQIVHIQQLMQHVMHEGEHFGKIPGCGDKPVLFKAGAEKLCFTFRMAPDFDVHQIDSPGGHREYRIQCQLYSYDGRRLGAGVGTCSTLEGKYRFRAGEGELTGRPVPREYWELRKTDRSRAQELLGGKGFGTAKNEAGAWEIVRQGARIEHDNPADYYNTVLKIAKKRALVDAVLTVTAASDLFTQDVEDLNELVEAARPHRPLDREARQQLGSRIREELDRRGLTTRDWPGYRVGLTWRTIPEADLLALARWLDQPHPQPGPRLNRLP